MKKLSVERLVELTRKCHHKFGVTCPICGSTVQQNDSNRLCGICAFEFKRDYPNITINGKEYKPYPKIIFGADSIDNTYILIYRKYYKIVEYNDCVLAMNEFGERFSTYKVIDRFGRYLKLEKGNVIRFKYQNDGKMYNTTKFVKKSNKNYQGEIL